MQEESTEKKVSPSTTAIEVIMELYLKANEFLPQKFPEDAPAKDKMINKTIDVILGKNADNPAPKKVTQGTGTKSSYEKAKKQIRDLRANAFSVLLTRFPSEGADKQELSLEEARQALSTTVREMEKEWKNYPGMLAIIRATSLIGNERKLESFKDFPDDEEKYKNRIKTVAENYLQKARGQLFTQVF